jgi:hypothetical protein
VSLYQLDGLFEVGYAGRFGTVVGAGDEVVNGDFVS